MSSSETILKEAVRNLFKQVCLNQSYRMLSKGEEPFEAERSLCAAIKAMMPLTKSDVDLIRQQLDVNAAYHLGTFAKRMANYAVRVNDPQLVESCAYGLVFDNDFVEWRDVLIDLAVLEDCARRLGVDFDHLCRKIAKVGTEKRKETIVDGYLARGSDMRGLRVMKVEASGPDHDLVYTRIPW